MDSIGWMTTTSDLSFILQLHADSFHLASLKTARGLLSAAALRNVGPAPCLGSTVELALVTRAQKSQPHRCETGRAVRLTNSVTTQAQIQDFELAHPNIYPICELLEHVKGQALQIQS